MAAAESTLISAAPATESASMEDSENQPMDQPHVAEATPTAALEELLEAGSGGEKKGKGGKKGGKKGKGKGGKKKKPKLSLAERRQVSFILHVGIRKFASMEFSDSFS